GGTVGTRDDRRRPATQARQARWYAAVDVGGTWLRVLAERPGGGRRRLLGSAPALSALPARLGRAWRAWRLRPGAVAPPLVAPRADRGGRCRPRARGGRRPAPRSRTHPGRADRPPRSRDPPASPRRRRALASGGGARTGRPGRPRGDRGPRAPPPPARRRELG